MAQLGLVAERRIDDPVSVEFMNRDLARSGLTPEDLRAYPIAPVALGKCGAYVIPYRDPIMWRIRYDRSEDKYHQPRGIRDVWWSPNQELSEAKEQPSIYIIEGEKKAAAFIKKWPHLFAFGIGGAHNALEKTEDGSKVLLANILKVLTPGKVVNAIFDGDILSKGGIQQAASSLIFACAQVKVDVKVWYPPEAKGIDDWLVASPNAKLADLVEITPDKLEVTRKDLYRQLRLTLNEDGNPYLNETNINRILKNYWSGRIINDKRLGVIMDGHQADEKLIENTSLEYIQERHFHGAKPHQVNKALDMALYDLHHDIVKSLVAKLNWDGIKRLETWGEAHLHTINPKVANEWGRLLMTALALRILEPGIKVDIVPILIGPQGIGKTTFFQELATFDGNEFYNSLTNFSSDAGDNNRSEVLKLRNSVVLDLAEGIIFNASKSSVELVKSRITQTTDTFRQTYARQLTAVPRGFIFVGTSNRQDLLSDQTGSRRFFMLKVLQITKLPYEIKLQILAEVVATMSQILATTWYEIRLSLEDLVVQDEHKHITNVQELLNVDFRRANSFEEEMLELIDNNKCAKFKNTSGYFVSPKYLDKQLRDSIGLRHGTILDGLKRLVTSSTFMYKVEYKRITEPGLVFPNDQIKSMYMIDIDNTQRQISGYAFIRK